MNHIIELDPKLASLEENIILRGYRGSVAHGTYEENTTHDDFDVMGIFMPPVEEVFGLNHTNTIERFIKEKLSEEKTKVWDIVYYSFPHFISLLAKQNPNVLMMLWLPDKFINKVSDVGKLLIANRDLFLTKQIYVSFCGYARGQLKRMCSHSEKKLKLIEFGAPFDTTIQDVDDEIMFRKSLAKV